MTHLLFSCSAGPALSTLGQEQPAPGDANVYFFHQIYSRDFEHPSDDVQVPTSLFLAAAGRAAGVDAVRQRQATALLHLGKGAEAFCLGAVSEEALAEGVPPHAFSAGAGYTGWCCPHPEFLG